MFPPNQGACHKIFLTVVVDDLDFNDLMFLVSQSRIGYVLIKKPKRLVDKVAQVGREC